MNYTMNKVYWILAFSLGLSAHAQTTISETRAQSPRSSIAPSIGVTSFALKAEGYEVGAAAGLSVGAQYAKPTGIENLDFELGLHYFETGGKQGNAFIENQLTFSYIAMPIGARWKFASYGNAPENKLYFKGGVSPSYLVSAKQKITFLGESTENDIKGQSNSFDLMAYAGFGGGYSLGQNQSILMELSYFLGTQNVLKEIQSKNEGLMASLMYAFEM